MHFCELITAAIRINCLESLIDRINSLLKADKFYQIRKLAWIVIIEVELAGGGEGDAREM